MNQRTCVIVEVEPFGGLVVRWPAFGAWLLIDVTGVRWVWRGRVLDRRAVVGLA